MKGVQCYELFGGIALKNHAFSFFSLISQLTSAVISLTGLLFDLTMTSIENLLLQTHLNQTTIALNPTSIFQSLSFLLYYFLSKHIVQVTALKQLF